jgi:intracellular septation protein A
MKNEHKKARKEEAKQASVLIAVVSVIGLTVCFVAATYFKADVPLILYAIFGGGILGTDNVLKFLKAIFRVGDGKN